MSTRHNIFLTVLVSLLIYGCASSSDGGSEADADLPPPTNDAYCIQKFGVPCAEVPQQ